MKQQHTLKIYPAGMGRTVYRVIEIFGDDTLDDLCNTILEAFDFFHEHLYEFCMDNRMYSEHAYHYAPEGGKPSTQITLNNLQLVKGQKFSLHYDFGDDWMFSINVQKIEEVSSYSKPSIIKEKGYVEQYYYGDDDG